eukprot:7437194-Lingulodinium_polyedra.AAC.1
MLQRQKLWYTKQAEVEGVESLPTEVLDWSVAIACANHDVQNALKWSLASCSEDGTVARRLFISVASVRNGFNHLHKRVVSFVSSKLVLSDKAYDPYAVYRFWSNLSVEPEVSNLLSEMNLVWEEGELQVDRKAGPITAQLVQKVAGCIIALMTFTKFTDS